MAAHGYILEELPGNRDPDSNLLKYTLWPRRQAFWLACSTIQYPVAIGLLAYTSHTLIRHCGGMHNVSGDTLRALPRDTIIYSLLSVFFLMVVLARRRPCDTLLVMKNVGLQLKLKRAWVFQSNEERFIPVENIIDVVIHEGFHGYGQVIFHLCVLMKANETENYGDETNPIALVFPQILPRKETIIPVWRESRKLLFGDVPRYWRRIPGKGLTPVI